MYMLQNPIKIYEEEQALLRQQEAAAKEAELHPAKEATKERRKSSTQGSTKGKMTDSI